MIKSALKRKDLLADLKFANKPTETQTILEKVGPLSINYHFTRACNMNCYFCFHKTSEFELLPLEVSKEKLEILKEIGMSKITLTGGEPLLHEEYLGELLKFCKIDLGIPCTTIVSNCSLLNSEFLDEYGHYLDVIGFSLDSLNKDTLERIGRKYVDPQRIKSLCDSHDVLLKINTVVNRFNFEENMGKTIFQELQPFRWKVFQVTTVPQENQEDRSVYAITSEEFESFVFRHQREKERFVERSHNLGIATEVRNVDMVVEKEEVLTDSYFTIDEKMRILNCKDKEPGVVINRSNIYEAIEASEFNIDHFLKRGGDFFLKDSFANVNSNEKI